MPFLQKQTIFSNNYRNFDQIKFYIYKKKLMTLDKFTKQKTEIQNHLMKLKNKLDDFIIYVESNFVFVNMHQQCYKAYTRVKQPV